MNTTTPHHLRRLLFRHGTFTAVAQALGLAPRVFRYQRGGAMPKSTRSSLVAAARALFLRALVRELLSAGAVEKDMLRAAALRARAHLDAPAGVHKAALLRAAQGKGV